MLSLIVLSLTSVATPQSQWDLPGAPQQPGHTPSVEEAEAEAAAEAMEAGNPCGNPSTGSGRTRTGKPGPVVGGMQIPRSLVRPDRAPAELEGRRKSGK